MKHCIICCQLTHTNTSNYIYWDSRFINMVTCGLKKKKLKISLDNTEDYLNFRFIKLVFVQQCDYTKLANLHLL